MPSETVTLGDVEITALPQPHAYLLHELERVLGNVFKDTTTESEFMAGLREGMYDTLAVFLPDLRKKLPPWEFHGYPTKDAWKAGEYDEEFARRSPTVPEIAEAFDTCVALNGDTFLSKLFAVVDPKVIRAVISDRILDTLSTISLSLPPMSGESAQTSSGETPPIVTPTGSESPSLASVG